MQFLIDKHRMYQHPYFERTLQDMYISFCTMFFSCNPAKMLPEPRHRPTGPIRTGMH